MSVQPTYDSRLTGAPYRVVYRVNGDIVTRESIDDPFIRGTITLGWRDIVRGLLRRGGLTVEVHITGLRARMEDVLMLDANYARRRSRDDE